MRILLVFNQIPMPYNFDDAYYCDIVTILANLTENSEAILRWAVEDFFFFAFCQTKKNSSNGKKFYFFSFTITIRTDI